MTLKTVRQSAADMVKLETAFWGMSTRREGCFELQPIRHPWADKLPRVVSNFNLSAASRFERQPIRGPQVKKLRKEALSFNLPAFPGGDTPKPTSSLNLSAAPR